MRLIRSSIRSVLGNQLYNTLRHAVYRRRWADHYGVRTIMDIESGSQYIRSMLENNTPFAAGKIGASELRAINAAIMRTRGSTDSIPRHIIEELHIGPGVFPATHAMAIRYINQFVEIAREMDVVGIWFNKGEQRFVDTFCANATLVNSRALDPFYSLVPWTSALAGKRVLVVTPFANTVAKQYKERILLWPDSPYMLPPFELEILKVPLSDAICKSPYRDWDDAYHSLRGAMAAYDFDVALVGAGAFSVPLAVAAKHMGRVGVHLGGSTQVLFGIRGGRWDDHPIISRFYNDYWVRPSPEETPPHFRRVELGAYW